MQETIIETRYIMEGKLVELLDRLFPGQWGTEVHINTLFLPLK